jgi:hypothetical protein
MGFRFGTVLLVGENLPYVSDPNTALEVVWTLILKSYFVLLIEQGLLASLI